MGGASQASYDFAVKKEGKLTLSMAHLIMCHRQLILFDQFWNASSIINELSYRINGFFVHTNTK